MTQHGIIWTLFTEIQGSCPTITQDIVKFRALQPGEDAQFCNLVHLVKRSFNMLKEVGSENDMDNTVLCKSNKSEFRRISWAKNREISKGTKLKRIFRKFLKPLLF